MPAIRDAMRRVKDLGWEKIEECNQRLDDESVRRYIIKIMEEDRVDYEEAWRLCREEPKYSMGLKMCSPAIVMMLKSEKGRQRFREMLTPEELEVFDREVAGKINFRKAVKQEFKRQRKKKGKEDDGDAVELSGLRSLRPQSVDAPDSEDDPNLHPVHPRHHSDSRLRWHHHARMQYVQRLRGRAQDAGRCRGAPGMPLLLSPWGVRDVGWPGDVIVLAQEKETRMNENIKGDLVNI